MPAKKKKAPNPNLMVSSENGLTVDLARTPHAAIMLEQSGGRFATTQQALSSRGRQTVALREKEKEIEELKKKLKDMGDKAGSDGDEVETLMESINQDPTEIEEL
jgi:hypothetical protein